MNKSKLKLSLDRPAAYQIKIQGHIQMNWADYIDDISVQIEDNNDEAPVTILTGIMDQASLQGLLRRLYSLGLPIISVSWLDCN